MSRPISVLRFRPGMGDNSISCVMRNLALAAMRNGYVVECDRDDFSHMDPLSATQIDSFTRDHGHPYTRVCRPVYDRVTRDDSREVGRVYFDIYDSWAWKIPESFERYRALGDLIVTTTERSRAIMQRSLGDLPIECMGLGVDTAIYHPTVRDGALLNDCTWINGDHQGKTVFMAAGYIQSRKGVPVLLEAFSRAFTARDNVCLLIKNSLGSWAQPTAELVALAAARTSLTIGLMEQRLQEYELARLFSAVDCYVSPHHVEGFGLMGLQAMACGTATIMTNHDGPVLTYATADNCALVPVGTEDDDGRVDIDPDVMAGVLRSVHDDVSLRARLAEGGPVVARRWTWDNAARQLAAAIESRVGPLMRNEQPAADGLTVGFMSPERMPTGRAWLQIASVTAPSGANVHSAGLSVLRQAAGGPIILANAAVEDTSPLTAAVGYWREAAARLGVPAERVVLCPVVRNHALQTMDCNHAGPLTPAGSQFAAPRQVSSAHLCCWLMSQGVLALWPRDKGLYSGEQAEGVSICMYLRHVGGLFFVIDPRWEVTVADGGFAADTLQSWDKLHDEWGAAIEHARHDIQPSS